MKRIIFICLRYLDDKKEKVTIGGIQTYVTNLISIAKELGLECVIIQPSKERFDIVKNDIRILGVITSERKGFKRFKYDLFNASKTVYQQGDIIVFAHEGLSVNTEIKNTIGIQHGISWDITEQEAANAFNRFLFTMKRHIKSFSYIKDSKHVKTLVCVDYNYINWIRTQIQHSITNYVVIPNFSKVPEDYIPKNDDGNVHIIFARRLQWYRGTRIFGEAILKILNNYNNVDVTIAGDGPDETYLRNLLKGKKVQFITYKSDESLDIHRTKDIAVVPSLGSEGTSLSLIEAMACSCATIATDVGGMTNIIIDGYNGLLVKPTVDSLYSAIEKLINNKELRKYISIKAHETVVEGFSYDIWKSKWINVIKEYM